MSEAKLFPNVKSVLVVLSSRSMAFDLPALRNFISYTYPQTAVFFISCSGKAVGVTAPAKVDLVIDFTRAGSRQPLFFARKMRSRATYAIGRDTGGFFGRKSYDRIYSESADTTLPADYMDRERVIQRKVLELSGVEIVKQGGVTEDLSKEIAQTLPPMQHR